MDVDVALIFLWFSGNSEVTSCSVVSVQCAVYLAWELGGLMVVPQSVVDGVLE